MIGGLRAFLATARPERAVALLHLRRIYLALFGAQTLVAMLLCALLLLLAGPPRPAAPLLAQIVAALSALQLPLGATLAATAARPGGKGAALSGTILAATLLSATSWYAAFGLLLGASSTYLLLLLALVSSAYALGFALLPRLATAATRPDPPRGERGERPPRAGRSRAAAADAPGRGRSR